MSFKNDFDWFQNPLFLPPAEQLKQLLKFESHLQCFFKIQIEFRSKMPIQDKRRHCDLVIAAN